MRLERKACGKHISGASLNTSVGFQLTTKKEKRLRLHTNKRARRTARQSGMPLLRASTLRNIASRLSNNRHLAEILFTRDSISRKTRPIRLQCVTPASSHAPTSKAD